MPEPPRRKRFQIHLSTAIVLMFVTGGLIWANTHERVVQSKIEWEDGNILYPEVLGYGWPLEAVRSIEIVHRLYFIRLGLTIDIAVAVFLLLTVYFLCEWLIRRRAASY